MRYCSKTACAREAVASYAFNYAERVVWLASLTKEPHPAFYDLCDVHTRSLRVPRGWSVDDLRSEEPSDQLPDVPARSGGVDERAPYRETAPSEDAQLTPGDEASPVASPDPEPPIASLPSQASFLA